MNIDIRPVQKERLGALFVPIGTVFGVAHSVEREQRARSLPELDTLFGAFDGEDIVGSAGAYNLDMTVPGGVSVETSGLTLVAVLPTHRRRGILRAMMRRHLDEAHARKQSVAALFASEGGIYGRFGYGPTNLQGEIEIRTERSGFVGEPSRGSPNPSGFVEGSGSTLEGATVRLVDEERAATACARVWEKVRLARPGMLGRSAPWWRGRRTADPEALRGGRPPLNRAVLEVGGEPVAYALYRFMAPFTAHATAIEGVVVECVGATPAATRAIWSYLFSHDLVRGWRASSLPPDHALVHLVKEPAALRMRLEDAVWVRLIDVGVALSSRRYGGGSSDAIVFDVTDAFCPWNEGRWRLSKGACARTEEPADIALDVSALGSTYLGGVSFTALALAERASELRPGALARGDAMFRASLLPWCPEIF